MDSTTARVDRLVSGLFGPGQEADVLARLVQVSARLGTETGERVQAAVVLASHGDPEAFEEQADLAEVDWRDVLVAAGLADDDWSDRVDAALDDVAIRRWDGPGVDAWDAWTPWEVARRLDGLDVPWCVVGGWAIDLALGTASRDHDDLEIAVARRHLDDVRRHLGDLVFFAVGGGEVRRIAPDEPSPNDRHQHWVLDEAAMRWRVDVMAEPGDGSTWRYRRDPDLHAPSASMVARSDDGIPHLRPHGVLLFKAKSLRPKDRRDFEIAAGCLDAAERRWLADALERFHPGHPWIDRLR